MAVTDRKVDPYSLVARRHIEFPVAAVGINQAAVLFGAVIPYQGLPSVEPAYQINGWVVEGVQACARVAVSVGQIDVQIGAVSVLTGLLTPGGPNDVAFGTLVAPASRRGKIIDQLNMRVTTNGSGTFTDLVVVVTIRPFPGENEAA